MATQMSTLPKFDFDYLYNFTHSQTIPQSYIVRPYSNQSILALTYDGCVAAVGAGINYYSRQDVYDRVLLWRVPLIALWATTTLPSFGTHTQIFTLVHLIADPIDTTWSLFYKLDLAKRTAHWAKYNDKTVSSFVFASESAPTIGSIHGKIGSISTTAEETNSASARTQLINEVLGKDLSPLPRYFHDVVALIVTAYDEWGYGEQASRAMNYGFNSKRWSGVQRTNLRKNCANAAFFIASDRVSRFLPSAAAGLVFLIQIFAGFWKTLTTLSDSYQRSNPVSSGLNRAPHNIAFGTLFFWLPFVVLMTALVGGSQTSHMIPRVLEDFRKGFERSHRKPKHQVQPLTSANNAPLPSATTASAFKPLGKFEADSFPDISSELYLRWNYGGLPVWQMKKFEDFTIPRDEGPSHRFFAFIGLTLSVLLVMIPTGSAMAVSWLTPTEGFGCRGVTQLSFLTMWITSTMIDWALSLWTPTPSAAHRVTKKATESSRARYLKIYQITFAKDLFFMAGTIVTLTWTSLGVFNKCGCWCKWPNSTGYISFPEDDFIFQMIENRLRRLFPILVTCALGSQMVIFLGVWLYFYDGYRVIKQQDIDSVLKSQPSRWSKLQRYFVRFKRPQKARGEAATRGFGRRDAADTAEEHPLIERAS